MRLRLGGTFWTPVPKISLQDIFEALVQINQAFSEDQYWLLFLSVISYTFKRLLMRLLNVYETMFFSLLKRKTVIIGPFEVWGVSLGLRRGVGQ